MNKIERMNKAIDDLLEKAEQASPGPWLVVEMPGQAPMVATKNTPGSNPIVCEGCRPLDAAYIAACDPAAIRAIIRYLRKQIDSYHKTVQRLESREPEEGQPQAPVPAASLEREAETLAIWLANAYIGRELLPDIDNGMSPPDPVQLREAARAAVAAHSDPEIMPLRGIRPAWKEKADCPEQDNA